MDRYLICFIDLATKAKRDTQRLTTISTTVPSIYAFQQAESSFSPSSNTSSGSVNDGNEERCAGGTGWARWVMNGSLPVCTNAISNEAAWRY